jgi:hypothetical protein
MVHFLSPLSQLLSFLVAGKQADSSFATVFTVVIIAFMLFRRSYSAF